MLLHHALMDLIEPTLDGPRSSSARLASKESSASSKHERQQRFELLISRLVRCEYPFHSHTVVRRLTVYASKCIGTGFTW
jgi:hypothetical protein